MGGSTTMHAISNWHITLENNFIYNPPVMD